MSSSGLFSCSSNKLYRSSSVRFSGFSGTGTFPSLNCIHGLNNLWQIIYF